MFSQKNLRNTCAVAKKNIIISLLTFFLFQSSLLLHLMCVLCVQVTEGIIKNAYEIAKAEKELVTMTNKMQTLPPAAPSST